jgi:chromosome partitioning protein
VPIITVSNQKGGVGKTTTTINLGAALQEMGKRVLLVDLDPQGSLSAASGILDVDAVQTSIGQLLIARARRAPSDTLSAIVRGPCGLDLVPGNGMLSAAEIALARADDRESILSETLAAVVDHYDYVLIDCLPSLGLMAINALRAANGVVIPVQADFLAVRGLVQMLETIGAVRSQLNPSLEIYGVLLTMVDSRGSHAGRVVNAVRRSLKDQVPVFETEIGYDIALKESAEMGKSILDLHSGRRIAKMYRDVARELALAAGDEDLPVEPPRTGVLDRLARSFGWPGRADAGQELNRARNVRAA